MHACILASLRGRSRGGGAAAAYVGRVYSCISMYDALGEGERLAPSWVTDEMKKEFRLKLGGGGGGGVLLRVLVFASG